MAPKTFKKIGQPLQLTEAGDSQKSYENNLKKGVSDMSYFFECPPAKIKTIKVTESETKMIKTVISTLKTKGRYSVRAAGAEVDNNFCNVHSKLRQRIARIAAREAKIEILIKEYTKNKDIKALVLLFDPRAYKAIRDNFPDAERPKGISRHIWIKIKEE